MLQTPSQDELLKSEPRGRTLEPCSLVIFGGAGDLARRKLLPALWNLYLDGMLPRAFVVVGFARTELDDEGYRQLARESIETHSRRPLKAESWDKFRDMLFFVRGSFEDATAYAALLTRLEEIEPKFGIPGNRIFYLSIPPSVMKTSVEHLQAARLVSPLRPGGSYYRVIVEKPIGHDLTSSRELNDAISRVFAEFQTYRIDHYLGKETVQNILVMRFANSILEPLWNQKYLDHVQITVAECEGVGTRANYYEEAGALRDMVQNHILQLVALTAMEPPYSLGSEVVRDKKLEVLECLRHVGPRVDDYVVRAQYTNGTVDGQPVPGYRRENGVSPDSTRETFVALKCFVDNWRWAGVPFYLRTGKRMARRVSEIAVQFRNVPPILFNADPSSPIEPNVLALRIQPDEGMSLKISAKRPGTRVVITPVEMEFKYGMEFESQSPEAYERLLLDVMAGDSTLFMRRDSVEAAWAWVTNILEAWEQSRVRWLPEYSAGSWGPVEADRLIDADGRKWRTP